MKMINMEQFGLVPDREEDATLAVYSALKQCRNDNVSVKLDCEALSSAALLETTVLLFPKGRYHFWPDKAVEKHYFITNHDQGGTRKIAFSIKDLSHLMIDGQGSEFIFHGPMIPFVLENCSYVTLANFSIDWERPMFEQGNVVEVSEEFFEFQLPPNKHYKVADNRLLFEYAGQMVPVWGLHDIDPITKAHAYQSGDRISWSSFKELTIEEVGTAGSGLIRVSGKLKHKPRPGSIIVMRIGRRENPGIFLKNCADTRIEKVAVYHAPGMGLVAQRCTNVHLQEFDVKLNPQLDRVITATADATHFTNCRGSIVLEHCLFENQLDDPCNVHGIYAKINDRLSEHTLLVKLIHEMQIGVEMAGPGDVMQFVRTDTLLAYAEATVASVDVLNAEYSAITFEQPIPDDVRMNDVVENKTWTADLTVRHCTVRGNRARGFLITTPGKVLLEYNSISAAGAGIKISGDANSWYESGAVRDVTIRNNRFLDCNYCFPDWGRAVIDIDPEIEHPELHSECYHHQIRIENNEFETFDRGIVYGHSIDGFVFKNNKIKRSGTYPPHHGRQYAVELLAVKNTDISNNECFGDSFEILRNGVKV